MKKIFLIILVAFASFSVMAQSSSNVYTKYLTSKSSIDTLEFGFLSKEVTAFNKSTETDTLFISADSSFPPEETFKRIGGDGSVFTTLLITDIATYRLFVKFGTTPTASKEAWFEVR